MNDRVLAEDRERALEFKRQFFWNAFKAIQFNGIAGDYVEFGCHGATTFTLAFDEICRRQLKSRMWACDSFQGLPAQCVAEDAHPKWQEGSMDTRLHEFVELCTRHGIPRDRYEIIPGFYNQSLANMPADHGPQRICLAYVDCDLYSSTRSVLAFLKPRISHGMILAFDDYFCWSQSQIAGERRAMLECFDDERWSLLPFVQYGWAGKSFVVEDRRLLPQAQV